MALSCPQESNFAAIAKQLHETAVEAENQIYDLEFQLRAAANRPTIVQTTTNPQSIPANVDTILLFPGITSNFNNTVAPSSMRISSDAGMFQILGEGVYEIGVTGNLIAVGAVDNNSVRQVSIQHHVADPSSAGPILAGYREVQRSSFTLFESNVGNGVDFSIVGHFRIKPNDIIFFTVLHGNTSSNLSYGIGGIGWLHKLSDSSITAVL